MFRAPLRPSSGAYNCTRSLWFYRWIVVGRGLAGYAETINQQDATVSQVYYLTFMCGSTCFGHLFAHHQERTTTLGASGFTVGALLVVVCQVMRKQSTNKMQQFHKFIT
jgi:hypothetical protein